MNEQALIDGQKYTFLETVSSLDKDITLILCANERGEKCVCPEQLWRSSAPQAEQMAPIHTHSSTHEKIKAIPHNAKIVKM